MEKYVPNKKTVVMSRDEVRAFDDWAINTLGIPGVVLMENAGRSCAELIKEKLKSIAKPVVCIFCGTGNNGGDGYVIARHLLNSGFKVVVVICGDRSKIKGDAKINLDILEKLGQPIKTLDLSNSDISAQVEKLAGDADMLVDALFGTGLSKVGWGHNPTNSSGTSGLLSSEYKQLIESINALNRPVLAVDIPSGLDCDTGLLLGAAIKADYTVTFAAMKKGFLSAKDVNKYTGEIFIASIGVEPTTAGTAI
jgi:NAD(P)H-hydrate epimerase